MHKTCRTWRRNSILPQAFHLHDLLGSENPTGNQARGNEDRDPFLCLCYLITTFFVIYLRTRRLLTLYLGSKMDGFISMHEDVFKMMGGWIAGNSNHTPQIKNVSTLVQSCRCLRLQLREEDREDRSDGLASHNSPGVTSGDWLDHASTFTFFCRSQS